MATLRCLHCKTPLNFADETLDQDISCPTCGSRSPLGERTEPKAIVHKTAIGRFELLEQVGRGQFGSVWRARDTRLERIVALKIPRRDDLDLHTRHMFLREANAAAALNHPNIVRVYEVFEEEGQIYIASEFINGDDLKVTLGGDAFLTYQDVVRFMISTAEAVHYAHTRGIIHRDIKPGNILVDGVQQPHLTDFGLAKIESHEATMTVCGDQPVGTLSYMSPEQAAGNVHDLDCRSDVFSLGVVFYEMLTRERPFPGVALDILDKVRHLDPVRPCIIKPELPRDLETVCLKALEKNPAARYQTALEFAEDLKRFLAGLPTVARPMTRREVAVRWVRKHITIAAIAAVALISTAAAATTTFFNVDPGVLVELSAIPSDAEFAIFPLDPVTGEPVVEKVQHTSSRVRLAPGDYWISAKLADGRFQEVRRHVPEDPNRKPMIPELFPHKSWTLEKSGLVKLSTIFIPELGVNDGMASFGEGNGAFVLDAAEVSIDAVRRAFRDRVPGNLNGSDSSFGPGPIIGLSFDYAMWYAELAGKRLPSDAEFEFAATNGGTTRYPWGNKLPSDLVDIEAYDATTTVPPVFGLVTGVDEFTASPFLLPNFAATGQVLEVIKDSKPTMQFGVAGTPFDLVSVRGSNTDFTSSVRPGVPRSQIGHQIGFRCARSKSPKWDLRAMMK